MNMGSSLLKPANGSLGTKLDARFVVKPWGRMQLPEVFSKTSSERVGEVCFITDEYLKLLAKYIFTSENLSVQVHPNDEQARSRGLASGKSECWFILDADPGARIGLGLRRKISSDTLRRAALDGSVQQLIEWRPVAAGDFFLVPPGTIHVIGAGISLLELQQNSDVTYRLYDYGRRRDLHLDDGIAVAECDIYPEHLFQNVSPATDAVLVDSPHFTLLHTHRDALQSRERLILPIDGFAAIDGEIAHPGECLFLREHQRLESVGGRLLVAAAPPVETVHLRVAA